MDGLMSWSSDFTGEIPKLSLPVGDHVAVFGPDDAAVAHHILSEFLRDCAVHRRAPDYQPSKDWGHGPNAPVKTYTEAQIFAAFGTAGERAAQQLLAIMKEERDRNRAAAPSSHTGGN